MKKLLLILPLIFGIFLFFPQDTHALSLVNPKIRIYGRTNASSNTMVTLAECEACSNLKVEGIVENIAVYIPKNLISSYYNYNLTFSFNWKTQTGVDIWFDRPGIIYKGTEVSGTQYNTWVNTYNSTEGGLKVKENWFSASFTAPYINLIDQGEFWILMPVNTGTMPENLVGAKLPYYLDFTVWSIGLETTSTGSGPSDEGIIIDNAKNDIINNQNENFIKDQFAQQERFDELMNATPPELDWVDESSGWLPAGPVDSLLNLPFTFFTNLFNNLNRTCQPVSLPLPFVNRNLTLPCISTLYAQIGITSFLEWVGVIVGTIILYNYLIKLYDWVDKTLELEDQNLNEWGGV